MTRQPQEQSQRGPRELETASPAGLAASTSILKGTFLATPNESHTVLLPKDNSALSRWGWRLQMKCFFLSSFQTRAEMEWWLWQKWEMNIPRAERWFDRATPMSGWMLSSLVTTSQFHLCLTYHPRPSILSDATQDPPQTQHCTPGFHFCTVKRNEPLLLHIPQTWVSCYNSRKWIKTGWDPASCLQVPQWIFLGCPFFWENLLEAFALYLFDSKYIQVALGKHTIALFIVLCILLLDGRVIPSPLSQNRMGETEARRKGATFCQFH